MAGLHALPSVQTRPQKVMQSAGKGLRALRKNMRRPAAVAWDHIKEHAYFFTAMGCADAAGFVHSVFTGLIVMAVSFLAIEWRVSKSA